MNLLLVFAGFTAYIFISTWWLKKKYRIKSKGFFVNYVNDKHKYIEWTLILLFFLGILFMTDETTNLSYWIVPFLLVFSFVRFAIQWLYNRKSKEYILDLNGLAAFVVFLFFLP